MRNIRKLLPRVKCLLLALLLLLCTACAKPADPQTPPAEEETPAVETQPETVTPEPEAKPAPEPEPEPEPVIETIQDQVNATGKKTGAVGIQVAVVKGGELYGTYNYGWAKKDQVELTEDHKFTVASISKVILSLATQLMREEGYIDLDTDISEYWGVEIKNKYYPEEPITIRDILCHTSTIKDPDADRSRAYEAVKEYLTTERNFINKEPGSADAFTYNNFAYDMLGMTLELASGRYVDDVMQERLYDAMDIQAGYFSDNLDTSLFTPLYSDRGYESMTVKTQAGATRGEFPGADGINFCGRLKTSAKDLAKLASLMAADGVYNGEQLVSPESIELMESTAVTFTNYEQCLGPRHRTNLYGRDNLYYHTGNIYGNYTFFSYDPDTGDAVVVLTTGADPSFKDSRGYIAAYGEIVGFSYKYLAKLDNQE